MQDCIAANAAYLYICTSLSVRYKHESPRGRVGTHSSLTSAGGQKLLVSFRGCQLVIHFCQIEIILKDSTVFFYVTKGVRSSHFT